MVHRKSEYRLQFHLVGKDLRTKIWQDNIKFRETCRMLNQTDHYWTYQLTDERCDCENDEEEDEATLPPHRLKHKILLAKYGSGKTKGDKNEAPQPGDTNKVPQPIIPSTNSGKNNQVQFALPEKDLTDTHERAVQSSDREIQEHRGKEELSHNGETIQQNLNSVSSELVKVENDMPSKEQDFPTEHLSPRVRIHESELQPQRNVRNEGRCNTSLGHYSERKFYPPSRVSSPTRTSRKAYFKDKKSPFAPFGWNDSDRDVGQKKTYNVQAPQSEVYSPALLALKRRREAIEKYLAEEALRKRQGLAQHSLGTVNHSSIWMSEYQEKFSHGEKFIHESLRKRPTSAPCSHRSSGWRYS